MSNPKYAFPTSVKEVLRPNFIVPLALLALFIISVGAMFVVFPQGESFDDPYTSEYRYASAVVTRATDLSCQGTTENRDVQTGDIPDNVPCTELFVTLLDGESAGLEAKLYAPYSVTASDFTLGETKITVISYAQDGDTWSWHDFERHVPLAALTIVFSVLLVAVAGLRGVRAMIGLGFALAAIGFYIIPGILRGGQGAMITLVASIVILFVLLYVTHGFSLRTSSALIGTVLGLVITTVLGVVSSRALNLDKVTSDEQYQLWTSIPDSANLQTLFLCSIILSALGVLNDATVAQASSVWELKRADANMSRWDLFKGGMRIGKDHLASSIYTIAFVYAGAALPVLLLTATYNFPFLQTVTSGEFAEEITRTLVCSIGLILAIPLTTAISAMFVSSQSEDEIDKSMKDVHAHSH
jgi:uncharacterized membrane protein